jgi:hypothetical protein
MKMGTIRSPWPYDAAACHALQPANLRRPAILYCASWGRVSSRFRRVVRLPFDSSPLDQSQDRRDVPIAAVAGGLVHRRVADSLARSGCVKSRTCSRRCCAAGLNVRFFSVMIVRGHGRNGSSIGSTFNGNRLAYNRATDFGNVPMKWPEATRLVRMYVDQVRTTTFGMPKPRARNASDTIR